MRVLFIGGTGIISSACTTLAAAQGIDLYLLNRSQRPYSLPPSVKTLTADIKNPDSVRSALGSLTFDAVANFIAFTPADIETDLALFTHRTAQYLFISSASVYQKPPAHYLVTESTPLSNPFWEYSRQKIAAEERLLRAYQENQFPAVIIRPSLTYGTHMIPLVLNSWARPWSVADRMLKNLPVIVPGDGTSLWQTTHNTDFAQGLIPLLGLPSTLGHAFHITTDEVLTQNQHFATLASLLNVTPHLVHLSSQIICTLEPNQLGGLLGDKSNSIVLDNTKIKSFVPTFSAKTTFRQGLEQSLHWFHQDPARQLIDDNYTALTNRLLAAHHRAITPPDAKG